MNYWIGACVDSIHYRGCEWNSRRIGCGSYSWVVHFHLTHPHKNITYRYGHQNEWCPQLHQRRWIVCAVCRVHTVCSTQSATGGEIFLPSAAHCCHRIMHNRFSACFEKCNRLAGLSVFLPHLLFGSAQNHFLLVNQCIFLPQSGALPWLSPSPAHNGQTGKARLSEWDPWPFGSIRLRTYKIFHGSTINKRYIRS